MAEARGPQCTARGALECGVLPWAGQQHHYHVQLHGSRPKQVPQLAPALWVLQPCIVLMGAGGPIHYGVRSVNSVGQSPLPSQGAVFPANEFKHPCITVLPSASLRLRSDVYRDTHRIKRASRCHKCTDDQSVAALLQTRLVERLYKGEVVGHRKWGRAKDALHLGP